MNAWLSKTLDYWSAGGLLLVPILVICFGIQGCFFRSRERLRRTIAQGRLLERDLEECRAPDQVVRVAVRHAKNGGGIAALLHQALRDADGGANLMEAMQTGMTDGLGLLRRDFIILGALTAVAPLVGLLGTVTGMIDTFDAVSRVSGETGTRVAAGISRALITTQFGLVVALPGVFGLTRLRRLTGYVEVIMAECRAHVASLAERKHEDRDS